MSAPASICLLRLSALGDVTHVLPLAAQIASHWPSTRLVWVCGQLEARLLEGIAGVELWPYDKRGGLAAWRALRRRAVDQPFEVLLNLGVALRAGLVSLALPARRKVGYDRMRSKELHGLFISERIADRPCEHVQETILAFGTHLGLPATPPRWPFAITAADQAAAEAMLPRQAPVFLISPCSSHRLRNWSIDGYAAVARHAAQRGFAVVLTGGRSALEAEYAAAIQALAGVALTNLVGKDTLKQFLAICARAHVLLSPDSGPMHMANATGLPVIGLHAATNPRRSGPYYSLRWCVDRYDAAARRYLRRPAETLRWGTKIERPGVMMLIEPAAVIERIEALVEAGALEHRLDLRAAAAT